MTLTEFLLARIADDEAWARARWEPSVARSGPDTAVAIRLRKECEAKRRIVTDRAFRESQNSNRLSIFGERILGEMATVYSDHPDYQQKWKP